MDTWNYKPARDLGMPLNQRLRSTRRESGLVSRLTHHAAGAALTVFLRYLEKLTVEGREHLPASLPFVIVANHASHFDALLLGNILPRRLRNGVFPIAAGDTFFQTPAQATLAAGLLNALPMWRKNAGRHGIEELRNRLTETPCGYILFPEGTRSRNGEMAAFKPGVGMLVAGAPVPVVPCHLRGTHQAWPPESRRPRIGVRMSVRIGEPLQFQNITNDRAGWQRIAADLERAVRALGEPHAAGDARATPSS